MPKDKHTGKDWLNYLLLGLFLYIAYLPLSSLLFAVKNDALTENFPPKYFFSAALHSGFLPLWNPYINFGLPVYADPGFAFWNPLTWVFGAIGYNPWLLSIEILTYIWLAGIFMYRLGIYLGHSRRTAFLMGLLFMCCGFFICHLVHTNFLTCAAFLPLVTQTFLQLQTSRTPKRLFCAAASIYLLVTGGHPAIPIGLIYFLFALLIGWVLTSGKQANRGFRSSVIATLKSAGWTNLLLLITVLGLTAPVWLSWLEIWPWFNRSSPIFQPSHNQQILGFTIPSWLSFLFPYATTAKTDFFGTVGYMRNGYFSFIGLALFLVALIGKKNRLQLIFLGGGFLMLALSLGGPVKAALYSHLPLLQYIRTNGEFRVFTLFSFILILSWPLEDILTTDRATALFSRIIVAFTLIAGAVFLITGIIFFASPAQNYPPVAAGILPKIKSLISGLPLSAHLLINSVILLCFLSTWFLLRKKIALKTLIPGLVIADLLVFCWLQIPITGVQRKSPGEIQTLLEDAPPGIPVPKLIPLTENARPGLERIVGRWSYYSKQPGAPILCDYPVLFSSTENYFHSPWPDSLNHHPFIFRCAGKSLQTPEPRLLAFSPTLIAIDVPAIVRPPDAGANVKPLDSGSTAKPDTLVVMQNDFPRWQAFLDDKPCPYVRMYGSFMGIALPAGAASHHILFRFSTPQLLWYLLISLSTGLILLLAAWWPRKPRRI